MSLIVWSTKRERELPRLDLGQINHDALGEVGATIVVHRAQNTGRGANLRLSDVPGESTAKSVDATILAFKIDDVVPADTQFTGSLLSLYPGACATTGGATARGPVFE
jgi:hypothetical protein